ncbi:MAG: two-component sensor histidine kinase [Devosiaceae bacterium]|nr:two-component sensor histidine kinase [Devosiaceae bacterium MH13]
MVTEDCSILEANLASEEFFRTSLAIMRREGLRAFVPFGSPLFETVEQVIADQSPMTAYGVDISTPRLPTDMLVNVYATPLDAEGDAPPAVGLMLLPQARTQKLDRQLTSQSSARSVSGLAAMLGHEIKNPLSGIRGAAQLLESSVDEDDRALTRLITDEADRIVKLVDRMEVFSDERPVERGPVNIHTVLEHVKRLGENGFASHIRFIERYDPSLPAVLANRDQMIQVFLNLVKNAAEAIGDASDGEVTLSTAFKPGIRLSVPGSAKRMTLPLEFAVHDNGKGIARELLPNLFDPFVTTKANGSGLGLALVAKIVRDNGGVVECESVGRGATFRVLMPVYAPSVDAPSSKQTNVAEEG